MGYIKTIVLAFIIAFCLIELIVNDKLIRLIKKLNNITLKNGKKIRLIKIITTCVLIIILVFSIKSTIYNIRFNLINHNDYSELEDYKKGRQKAFDQRKIYKEIIENTSSNLENSKNPYIPDGFKYVEGNWDTGYVISDENGNEFVWVPCTNNKNDENIPIIRKWDQINNANEKSFSCYETEEYEDFLISSIQNGGFYVSRYEIGKENESPVSKNNVEVWVDITYNEAKEISRNMYDDSSIHSRLINGYAYDTIFSFVWDDINKLDQIIDAASKTGRYQYKNIYDIIDRLYEMTSEEDMGYMIVRGCGATEGYGIVLDTRMILEKNDLKSNNYGFRTILYR